ncbi:MAG: hypothetical protein OHK0038_06180 [Flammeovirgaceae bacterium]
MIMIGVSTGQNITNLIPAVQRGIKVTKLILLETSTAISKKWSQGLLDVLQKRNISVECISLQGIDSHISNIQKKLSDRFKEVKEPLIWNLGGGQKPQQIPIWEVFKMRNEKMNIPDIVCYANQDDTGILEIWEYQNANLTTRSERISVDLSAEEIFKVFGFNFREEPQLIYQKQKLISFEYIPDLLEFQEFRELMFRLPVQNHETVNQSLTLQFVKNIFNKEKESIANLLIKVTIELISILQKENGINRFKNNNYQLNKSLQALNQTDFIKEFTELIKQNLPFETIRIVNDELRNSIQTNELEITQSFLQKATNGKYNKTSSYFEHIVIQRVVGLLQSTNHNIIQAFANLKTEKNGQQVAEYDVLCVTEKGTILALDAKTFEFENKDIDARIYNLEQGSGFYRKFSAVFPYDFEDIENDWFKPIRRLPFDLTKKGFKFYVINDSSNSNFWIKNENGTVLKTKNKTTEASWIECKVLDNFLQDK